jgi:transposase
VTPISVTPQAGRKLLGRLEIPEPCAGTLTANLELIEDLDERVATCERDLRRLGADHSYVPLLMTAPGIAWVMGYTIASKIGDISRFSSPKKLTGYTGLCPKDRQSGECDHRGPLSKNGPRYLRWALIQAATHAAHHPVYVDGYERPKRRLGKQRGSSVARVEVARKLAEALWYMLTRSRAFAPAGLADFSLVA